MTTPEKYIPAQPGVCRLLVSTQVHENYGDAKNPYWKAKGGNEYCIAVAGPCLFGQDTKAMSEALVEAARKIIDRSDDYIEEYIVGWSWTEPGELTWFEQAQQEHEGKIVYHAIALAWVDEVFNKVRV